MYYKKLWSSAQKNTRKIEEKGTCSWGFSVLRWSSVLACFFGLSARVVWGALIASLLGLGSTLLVLLGLALGGRTPVGGNVLFLVAAASVRVLRLLVLPSARLPFLTLARVSLILVALLALARRRRGRALVVAQVQLPRKVQLLHHTLQQVLDLRLVALVDRCTCNKWLDIQWPIFN